MRRSVCALMFVASAMVALPGAEARADDKVAAEALFRQARAAAARGDYGTACRQFEESQRLEPAPGTLMNLGECRERDGLFATAWQHYREAADVYGTDPRASDALARAAALEPRVGRLTIKVAPGSASGQSILRDGVALGPASLDIALPADPGRHEILVSATGRAQRRYTVSVAEGEAVSVVVEPGAPLSTPESGPAATTSAAAGGVGDGAKDAGGARTTGFVLVGVGALALTGSAVTGLMTLTRKNTVEQNCEGQACNPAGVDAASEGRTLSNISTGAFFLGLAAIGVGTWLVLDSGGSQTPSHAIAPSVGVSHAGLRYAGTF